MDLSHLTAADRAQIEGFIHGKPQRRELVEKLLAVRATKTTDSERRKLDEQLIWMVTPSKLNPMLPIGLFVVVPIVAVVAFMIHQSTTHDAALAEGTPVVARVDRVAEGNCLVGQKGSHCLELSLLVWPTTGAPYAASLTHDIEDLWLSRVQPGSYLTVVVDKNDPRQLTFDERAMQVAAPTPPVTAP